MGEVYRATDERLGREVALKLLPVGLGLSPANHRRAEARLLREARAASALSHPGIVTLHDVGVWRGQLFLVMELVDGEPFSALAQRGIGWRESLRLIAEAADALAAAHAHGILHRDIKSDNLMRRRDGRATVVDFGVAKILAAPTAPIALGEEPEDELDAVTAEDPALAGAPDHALSDPHETTAGSVEDEARDVSVRHAGTASESAAHGDEATSASVATRGLLGTPEYMAPECLGGETADALTEVYALGAVLYELLSGQRPPSPRSGPLSPPSRLAPERDGARAADMVALRALALDRTARLGDMKAFAQAARNALRPLRPLARQALGAAAVLVLGLGAFVLVQRARGNADRSAESSATPGNSSAASVPDTVTGAAASNDAASTSSATPWDGRMWVGTPRQLTTEAGCQEFPAFAADGAEVIYTTRADGDEDLFALTLATGERTRLTRAPDSDFGARVSPDGKLVAYVHHVGQGEELRVIPRDGGEAHWLRAFTLASGYPAWAPDGALLIGTTDEHVVRWGSPDPSVARSDLATLPTGSFAHALAVAPNGRIFTLWQRGEDRARFVASLEPGRTLTQLVALGTRTNQPMLVVRGTGVYFSRPERGAGSGLLRVSVDADAPTTPEELPLEPRIAHGFDVSRDGTKLVYSTCDSRVFVARLRPGAAPEPLFAHDEHIWQDAEPAPLDSHSVLFVSDRSGSSQVFAIDLATEATRALAAGGSGAPSASPDGSLVVYASSQGLFLVASAGGNAVQLTTNGSDTDPRFDRSGRTVVFTRGAGDVAQLMAVELEGHAAPRLLASAPASEGAPSPTDDSVVFVRDSDSGASLWRTDLHGAKARRLAAELPPGRLGRPRFAADGKRLLVLSQARLVLELEVDSARPAVERYRGDEIVDHPAYAPDGEGFIAAVRTFRGHLWLAEGQLP